MDAAAVNAKAREIITRLCERFEGLRLRPYRCPAGVATIGLGSTRYEDGSAVRMTDAPITKGRAYALFNTMLETTYLPPVRKFCPASRDNANLQAALGDFCYNLGPARLAGSTLRRKINAGDIAGAKRELMKFTHGGGRVLKGLVVRRKAEAGLL